MNSDKPLDIDKQVELFFRQPYHWIIIPAPEGCYYASIAEFPEYQVAGDTVEEAWQNLEEIAKVYIKSSLENNQNIPEPFGLVKPYWLSKAF